MCIRDSLTSAHAPTARRGPLSFDLGHQSNTGLAPAGNTPTSAVLRARRAVSNRLALTASLDRRIASSGSSGSPWKYIWVTEHHCLPEYSHLSANESFIPYALAIPDRIHVGSGLFNINPIVNHPVRLAERVVSPVDCRCT